MSASIGKICQRLPVRYVGICRYNMPVHYLVGTICRYNMLVQYVGTICRYNMLVRYVGKICRYNMSVQYVGTICRYNMLVQYVGTICRYNMSIQYVGTICQYTNRAILMAQAVPNLCVVGKFSLIIKLIIIRFVVQCRIYPDLTFGLLTIL